MKLKKWYKEAFERNEFDFIEIYRGNEHYEEGKDVYECYEEMQKDDDFISVLDIIDFGKEILAYFGVRRKENIDFKWASMKQIAIETWDDGEYNTTTYKINLLKDERVSLQREDEYPWFISKEELIKYLDNVEKRKSYSTKRYNPDGSINRKQI